VNKIWRLEERIRKDDFRRRLTLFRYLESVMSYGVEIWGWKEKKELEKIWMDYVRYLSWIFIHRDT